MGDLRQYKRYLIKLSPFVEWRIKAIPIHPLKAIRPFHYNSSACPILAASSITQISYSHGNPPVRGVERREGYFSIWLHCYTGELDRCGTTDVNLAHTSSCQNELSYSYLRTCYGDSTNAYPYSLTQGLANFFLRNQITNISGFMGHTISITTTQLCHCRVKAALDNT